MRNSKFASVVLSSLAVLTFASCSSKMSRKDCDSTDYYKMGEKDGKDGKNSDHFNQVSQECSQLGANVASQQYQSGRTVGLSKYCTDSRGKSDAKDTKTDSICFQEKFPPYMSAYQAEVSSLKEKQSRELEKLKSENAKTQKKVNDTQNQINKLESEQNAAGQK